MNNLGVSPKRNKRFVVTTDSDHEDPVAEKNLNHDFQQINH